MKYKLINTETKTDFICEKIEINGFEYYVYNEKSAFVKGAMFITIDNIIHSNYGYNYLDRVVIASNNPTLDIPQVVDEVEEMCDKVNNNDEFIEKYEDSLHYYSFKEGYNKAKEQYPYSKQDMIDFVRFSMAKELTSDRIKNLPDCLELFEQQRPKTIYFK